MDIFSGLWVDKRKKAKHNGYVGSRNRNMGEFGRGEIKTRAAAVFLFSDAGSPADNSAHKDEKNGNQNNGIRGERCAADG